MFPGLRCTGDTSHEGVLASVVARVTQNITEITENQILALNYTWRTLLLIEQLIFFLRVKKIRKRR